MSVDLGACRIRPLREADAEAVLAIQALAYPSSHHESWAVLGRRLQLWPQGCCGAERDGRLLGYAFSHPWRQDRPVPLHGALAALPEAVDCYHLHDLALHPAVRGSGLAKRLVEAVLQAAQAAQLSTLTLVAVQGSQTFWTRMGFEPRTAAQTADYGVDAVAMQRSR